MDQDDYMANYYRYLAIIASQPETQNDWTDLQSQNQDNRAANGSDYYDMEATQ